MVPVGKLLAKPARPSSYNGTNRGTKDSFSQWVIVVRLLTYSLTHASSALGCDVYICRTTSAAQSHTHVQNEAASERPRPVSHNCIDYHFRSSTLLLAPYSRPDDRERTEIIAPLTPFHSMSPFNLRHPFPFLTFGRDDQHKPQGCGTRTSLVPSHSYSQLLFFLSFDFSSFIRSAQR